MTCFHASASNRTTAWDTIIQIVSPSLRILLSMNCSVRPSAAAAFSLDFSSEFSLLYIMFRTGSTAGVLLDFLERVLRIDDSSLLRELKLAKSSSYSLSRSHVNTPDSIWLRIRLFQPGRPISRNPFLILQLDRLSTGSCRTSSRISLMS